MEVKIVTFPETTVASITHLGSPESEHDTVRKLVAWKLQNQLFDKTKYRHYGLHHTDPRSSRPGRHRVDFCISYEGDIAENNLGIERMRIPALKCAYARDVGSRQNNAAAVYLYENWLPNSGEELFAYPMIFHYVNVGPNVASGEAITDVFMPIK